MMVRASKPLPPSNITTRRMSRAVAASEAAPSLQSNAAIPKDKTKSTVRTVPLPTQAVSTALEFVDAPVGPQEATSNALVPVSLGPPLTPFSLDDVLRRLPATQRPPIPVSSGPVDVTSSAPLVVVQASRRRAHTPSSKSLPAKAVTPKGTCQTPAPVTTPHHPLMRSSSGGPLAPLSVARSAAHISPVLSEGVISTPHRRRSGSDASVSWDSITSPSVTGVTGAQVDLFLHGVRPASDAVKTPSPFVLKEGRKRQAANLPSAGRARRSPRSSSVGDRIPASAKGKGRASSPSCTPAQYHSGLTAVKGTPVTGQGGGRAPASAGCEAVAAPRSWAPPPSVRMESPVAAGVHDVASVTAAVLGFEERFEAYRETVRVIDSNTSRQLVSADTRGKRASVLLLSNQRLLSETELLLTACE